ncbi:hypothetical protein OKW43_000046 [Paraburkholderia sp. WC7.3g]|uniref:hypothetical protein n=1 Tax=Paraburkholderia sp. WC7.3g TaxID=2991070 RepID=UPI003D1A9831
MRFMPFVAAGVVASVAFLAGCSGTAPTLTFQQQVQITCGLARGEMTILQSDGVFTGGAADTASKKVQPAIDGVCAAAANITDIQALVNAALPALKVVIAGSSLSPQAQNEAKAAIDTVILAANAAIALQPAVVATVPASAAAAASAPVAASQ